MRLPVTIVVVAATFLTSCAYEGVVVEKRSRPHPLYHSVGIEGVYTFVLRDQSGALHRQMVSPEVFEQYGEGDYFNDLQPPVSGGSDFKQTRAASVTPKAPVKAATASGAAKSSKAKRVAAKPQSTRTKSKSAGTTAKRTPSRVAQSKTRQAQRTTGKRAATKTAARAAAKTNRRGVAKKNSKPWKMTEPSVEAAPTAIPLQIDPASPAEGPASVAEAPPAPQRPPAAKPEASPEADIVYIPPSPPR